MKINITSDSREYCYFVTLIAHNSCFHCDSAIITVLNICRQEYRENAMAFKSCFTQDSIGFDSLFTDKFDCKKFIERYLITKVIN